MRGEVYSKSAAMVIIPIEPIFLLVLDIDIAGGARLLPASLEKIETTSSRLQAENVVPNGRPEPVLGGTNREDQDKIKKVEKPQMVGNH